MSANLPNPLPPGAGNSGGTRHPDPADLPLYAMQLLSGEETAVIAEHLKHCVPCSEELARILGDLTAYSLTAGTEAPPAAARARLLQQVAREKKVVPIARAQPQAQTQPQVQPQPQSSHPAPIASFGRSGSVFDIEPAKPKHSTAGLFLTWAGWAAAAVLAVATMYLYRDRQSLNNDLASETSRILRLNTDAAASRQLMDTLTDPKAVRVTLTTKPQPKPGPIGGITYNPDKGTLIFLASDLDPLQQYKTYELWVIPQDGGTPIPAGTFHPDDQGNASVILPDLPRGIPAKSFGVTIEDSGGAQTPTMPIIMAGN
jgi:anti-sigma-K factor RskA